MAAECELSAALCRAFHSALLLTGSPVSAEHAVSSAIESLSSEDLKTKALLFGTIEAAIRCSGNQAEQTSVDATHDGSSLPSELKAVLHMKPSLRYCFVVRVLLGLPVEECARLLRLRPVDVKARAAEAVLWLADHVAMKSTARVSAWLDVTASYSPLWQ
jgi:DNA-directed RNA polymerase specialized sigma24 family protein